MRALVIGRFQPFHLGHLSLIEYVASKAEFMILGVGSSNNPVSVENPFTFDERSEMINNSLDIGVGYEIVGIPDFNDNKRWISWIKDNIVFDSFFGNSENEVGIFKDAGIIVVDVPFFERDLYSATEVRGRMVDGGGWEALLPPGSVKVIRDVNGIERIKNLM